MHHVNVPLPDVPCVRFVLQMVIVLEIIARAISKDDKVLVFSQRRLVLDFMERVLMTKGWGGFVKTPAPVPAWRYAYSEPGNAGSWGPWENGKHYFRLDGTTPSKKRRVIEGRRRRLPYLLVTKGICQRLQTYFAPRVAALSRVGGAARVYGVTLFFFCTMFDRRCGDTCIDNPSCTRSTILLCLSHSDGKHIGSIVSS